jgi:hypothetical protein
LIPLDSAAPEVDRVSLNNLQTQLAFLDPLHDMINYYSEKLSAFMNNFFGFGDVYVIL